MKRLFISIILLLTSIYSFAQEDSKEVESVRPTTNSKIYRQVSFAEINNKNYVEDIGVSIQSKYDFWYGTTPIVKIKAKSLETGRVIYRKKLYDTYLYIFRKGQIQVGKPNLEKLIIFQSSITENWYMQINDGGIF